MHLIEFFYSKNDSRSTRALYMVKELSKTVPELLILGFDVNSEAGVSQTIKKRINSIPCMIVDRKSIIEGVPYSQKQIIEHFRKD